MFFIVNRMVRWYLKLKSNVLSIFALMGSLGFLLTVCIILSTTCTLFGSVLDDPSAIWVLECLSLFESCVLVFVSLVLSSVRLSESKLKLAINHAL